MRRDRVGFWAAALAWLAVAGTGPVRAAGPDDDAPESELPGLLATFSAARAGGPVARHHAADFVGEWGLGAPDPRVPADDFEGRWTGLLLIQSPGPHRFFARTDGAVVLRVAGREVLDATGATTRSEPIDLHAGFVPIALEYRHRRGEARVAIDWEGPGFAREPVPARLLYHERPRSAPPDPFEDGRRLADRFGCANCHALLDLPRHPDLGPPLTDSGRAIDPRWLDAWLADPASVRPRTRMPAFGHGFTPAEVADLAAFLAGISARPTPPTAEVRMALNVASPERGRLLFRSVGCLACHSRGTPSSMADPTAPTLADLGRKRDAAWLASFLEHPRSGQGPSRHRPDFRLTADEATHLAAYLVTDPPPPLPDRGRDHPPGDAARGRALAERARCASCHAIPGLAPRPADLPLAGGANPRGGCLAADPADPFVPRFALEDAERAALGDFVAALPRSPSPTAPATRAADTVRRLNCLGCHARDAQGGGALGARVAALLADDPALGGLKGTLTPPDLTAVGDKLRPDYLAQAVRGAAPTSRPWLSVRMPSFAFEPGEADAIVALFRGHDRMSPDPDPPADVTRPDRATVERAAQLIGQRGFGCLSCHVLAGRVPPGGEPETLGPDLALAHRRMTGRYFHRWIANPQRIIAGTPMPQFVQPVATVPGALDDQLATIWQLLGSPRVAEVAASGTREVLKRQGDRALVVRDMVLVPEAPDTPYTPRGLAIGLKNDHALLFDTDRLTWIAWWRGGFLSRTKSGRLWEWHPEGERLWTTPARGAPIVFLGPDGAVLPPVEVRERFGRFAEIDFEGPDVTFAYQLNGPEGVPTSVQERISPLQDGWERKIRVLGVPPNVHPALVERPPGAQGATAWTWDVDRARVTLRTIETFPSNLAIPGESETRVLKMTRSADGSYTARVRLTVSPAP